MKLLESAMTLGELEKISKRPSELARTLKESGSVKEEISYDTTAMRNMIELMKGRKEVSSELGELTSRLTTEKQVQ